MASKQIKIDVDLEALAMIDKAIKQRGMTRSEFMVHASLSFCDANPFSKSELTTIRKIVRAEIAKNK